MRGGGPSIGMVILIVNLILKLTGAVNMPWWSWNPFEWNVFIGVVWFLYLIIPIGLLMAWLEINKND